MKVIVKVQQSIVSSDGIKRVLVYDEDRQNHYEGPIPKEIEETLAGRLKAYFYADVPIRPGFVTLLEEAPEQSW